MNHLPNYTSEKAQLKFNCRLLLLSLLSASLIIAEEPVNSIKSEVFTAEKFVGLFGEEQAMIDLDTTKASSTDGIQDTKEQSEGWIKSAGLDFVSINPQKSGFLLTKALWVAPEDWNSATPESIRASISQVTQAPERLMLDYQDELKRVAVFETREGGIGILRFEGVTDNAVCLFRYKLIEGTATAPNPKQVEEELATNAYPVEEELWQKIAQREDPELRKATLETVAKMLSVEGNERVAGLLALRRTYDVPYDRTPFHPLVKACLSSSQPNEIVGALQLLPTFGGSLEDIPMIAKLASHPNKDVRSTLSFALFQLDKEGVSSDRNRAVLGLLNDSDREVVKETFRSSWGYTLSPEAEARVIELSQNPSLVSEAVYFCLSTRPVVSLPVAERLIDVMSGKVKTTEPSRAAWGLCKKLEPEAVDLVVEAVIAEYDATLDHQIRSSCLQVLRQNLTESSKLKLMLISQAEENQQLREAAEKAIANQSQ